MRVSVGYLELFFFSEPSTSACGAGLGPSYCDLLFSRLTTLHLLWDIPTFVFTWLFLPDRSLHQHVDEPLRTTLHDLGYQISHMAGITGTTTSIQAKALRGR